MSQGYVVRDDNWRGGHYELNIVAYHQGMLLIICDETLFLGYFIRTWSYWSFSIFLLSYFIFCVGGYWFIIIYSLSLRRILRITSWSDARVVEEARLESV